MSDSYSYHSARPSGCSPPTLLSRFSHPSPTLLPLFSHPSPTLLAQIVHARRYGAPAHSDHGSGKSPVTPRIRHFARTGVNGKFPGNARATEWWHGPSMPRNDGRAASSRRQPRQGPTEQWQKADAVDGRTEDGQEHALVRLRGELDLT